MSILNSQKDYFSLAILSHKLQLVVLNSKGNKVLKAIEQQISPEIINVSEVVDIDKLASLITQILQKNSIKQEKVIVGIPEEKVFTKVITFPDIKLNEIDEAVRWQAKTFLPTPIEESYLDWRIIKSDNSSGHTVLAVSIPKKIVNGYVKAFKKAGLHPLSFETTSISLARLVEDKKELTIVAEVQPQAATLTLCKGAEIMASSVVSLTGKENGVGEAYFLQTLKRMSNFYEDKYQEEIKEIHLCGQEAGKELQQKVESSLEKKSQLCNLQIGGLKKEALNRFITTISLCQRKVAAPRDETTINLLPPQIQKKYDRKKRRKTLKRWIMISTIAIITTSLASIGTYLFFYNRINSLNKKKQMQSMNLSLTAAKASNIRAINQQSQKVLNLANSRNFPQEIVFQIIELSPENISLTDLEYDMQTGQVILAGTASDREDLLNLKRKLVEEEKFKGVIIPISNLEKEKNLNFSLSFKIINNEKN